MILIADFDDERRSLLEDFIQEDLGFTAVGVNSARAMWSKIEAAPYKLVVISSQLPDMNGKEMDYLRKIRARFSPLELPVILLEDENKPDAIAKALSQGCNDCISLPIKMPVAVARIRNQLMLRDLMQKHIDAGGNLMPSLVPEESEPAGPAAAPASADTPPFLELAQEQPADPSSTGPISLDSWMDSLSNPSMEPVQDTLDLGITPPPATPATPDLSASVDAAVEQVPERDLAGKTMSLREWIRRMGNAAEDACVAVLVEMAHSLAYAHQQAFVHREVTSETVTIFPDGQVLINGVGVGTQITAKGLRPDPTITNPIRGMPSTPIYAAPEQLKGMDADHRADIYTFGILAYEILAGRPPFYGESLSAIVDKQIKLMPPSLMKKRMDIDLDLDSLVFKCIKKNASERFQSAEELVNALEQFSQKKYKPTGQKPAATPKAAQPKAPAKPGPDVLLTALMAEKDPGKNAVILEQLTAALKKQLPDMEPDDAVRLKNAMVEPQFLTHLLSMNLNRNNTPLLYGFFKTLAYNKAVIILLNHFNSERDAFKKQTLGELAVLSAATDLFSLVIFGLELEDRDACILLKAFGEMADSEPQPIFQKWARHRGLQTQMELLRIVSAGNRPPEEVRDILTRLAEPGGTVHAQVREIAQRLLEETA